MKQKMAKKLLCIAAVGMMFPMAVQAAEADLQLKLDQLTKEVNDLKGTVKKVEDKSLAKWLTIGGDYRFRMDSLHGETVAYSDALGTMNNMVGAFINGTSYLAPGTTTRIFQSPVAGMTGSTIDTDPTSLTFGNVLSGMGFKNNGDGTTGIYTPSTTSFFAMAQSGQLFSKSQFGTILGSYMPTAMYGAIVGANPLNVADPTANIFNPANPNASALVKQFGIVMGAYGGDAAAAAAGTKLTAQQQSILKTFMTYGLFDAVMGQMTVAQQTAFGLMSDDQKAVFNNLLMGGFLGANSAANPTSFTKAIAAFKPKNETIYTNKFSLDLKAKAAQDLTVNVKLDMYKTFGSQSDSATSGGYFADRVGVFDGTLGHVPSTGLLNVDRAYATWSNIADQPVWFSVGRRPATNGAPSNLRMNTERPGNGGTPALLVDYAFDGMTIGYAPDIDFLPGFYTKLCYGRGFESGLETPTNSIKDTDMLGFAVIPVDTDPLRVWLQWNRGFSIFDFPVMSNTLFGNTAPAVNLGSIDWYGAGAMSTLKDIGPGSLNFFADLGLSITHPNLNVSDNAGFQGLLSGAFFAQDFAPKDETGWAGFVGIRYDLPSKTKIGFEFNHGSKNWIPFSPSADDLWTAKVGTRGNVFEPYLIQELDLKPISSHLSKGFIKVGYQYYDFEYTGSNNWVGAPVKISDIKSTDLMLMAPVKKAQDIYATFEVKF